MMLVTGAAKENDAAATSAADEIGAAGSANVTLGAADER